MIKKITIIALTLCVLLLPVSSALADGNGNGSTGGVDTAPPDPGVSSGQDTTKTETIRWVLPHGDTFIIDGEEVNIVLDWENLNITDNREPGNGSVIFIGIGGAVDQSGDDSTSCGSGNGRGNCNQNGNGNGNSGDGGGPLRSDNCGGVWVTPGGISATAQQIAPNYAVIVGQDPDETGVTINYHININPTVISYEKWTIVGQRKIACVEGNGGNSDQNRNGNGHDDDWENGGEQNRYGCGHNDCDCPNGWHPVIEHIWACTVKERTYKEGIDDLMAGASLTLGSRAWILGDLANAYPGARLINPDWGISTQPGCTWVGDTCTFDFTTTIPVVDPGWYDIKLEGLTEGTKASPARSFEVVAGQFGVYLMDNTAMTQ